MTRTLLDYYTDLEKDGVVLFFNGPISQSVVEGIGELIRQKVATTDSSVHIARKVFSVMVEQMQNVICYSLDSNKSADTKDPSSSQEEQLDESAECGSPFHWCSDAPTSSAHSAYSMATNSGTESSASYGTGQLIVRKNEEGYYVACSNRIQTAQAKRIQSKVAVINAMNKEELKAYYKQQRKSGPDAASLGAGLGFIEMARKASKPLDIDVRPLDDTTSIFSVAVCI